MPLHKTNVAVGMRVQDASALEGTIRWIGKMEKKDKPPHGDTGTYCLVEFDIPWPKSTHRFNGIWEGTKLHECPEGSCELQKPTVLYPAMNERALQDLRKYYGDKVAHMPDFILIKFCVARKFEMPKVVEMLNKHLDWVASYKPTCDIFFTPALADFYPVGYIDGLDREGNLIYVERPGNGGKHHPNKFMKTFGIELISQWHVAIMEEGRKRIREHPTARRITMIIDLTKLGDCDMSVVKFGKAIGAIDQDHYPEQLAKMFIVNASGLFTGVWRLVRAFIDDRTKHKIQVLGENFMPIVEKQIEPEYIPDCIGGPNKSWYSRGGCIGSEDPNKVVEAKSCLDPTQVATPKEGDASPDPASGSGSGQATPEAKHH
jgi:hypothetical protein